MSDSLPKNVSRMLDEIAPTDNVAADDGTIYRIDANTKVPVSKHQGTLLKGRIDSALAARKPHCDAWDECIRYYNNSQLEHRAGNANGRSGNRYFSARRNNVWSETENIVYANTRAMMPAVYAKNPQVEFTATNDEHTAFVQSIEDLVNVLAAMPHEPGLNLKVHARQGILSTEITNLGWLECSYTEKSQSTFGIIDELERVSKELSDAKNGTEIRRLEGQLMALEESIAFATPAGPSLRYRTPHDILVDAGACLPDFSDAMWMASRELYPTDYLNARYGNQSEDGHVKSVYSPTHVLLAENYSADDEVKNFKLFSTAGEAHEYGYTNDKQLAKAHRTECWRIWDKFTRRVYLYAANKWDWPIWAENDPYGFPMFFPFTPLYFNTTPIGAYARSNVTYYLDQQDGINEIHDEYRRARQDVKENVLYDDKFNRDTVEKWLAGATGTALGVTVPEGMSLKDMILEKPNAMLRAMPLFDPTRLYSAIDRISGVSDVLRNAQFKTNTTNKAIENYNSTTQLRLDEKIDAIEDWLGRAMYQVGFVCAQKMPKEDVEKLIGTRADAWVNYDSGTLRTMFQCAAVGGSTQKPTSSSKKQEALEMARLLAQMTQFAPATIIETTLTLFNNAFDEMSLPDNWAERIAEESATALRRGSSDVNSGDAAAPQNDVQQIAGMIDSLPPQAKIALGNALAKGAPIAEALPEVLRIIQQGTQQGA